MRPLVGDRAVSAGGLHIATVRQFNPATGIATVVVPSLYGDVPIEARPILSSPAEATNLPVLDPGDTVIAFYDGGDPLTLLRWYLTGGHGSGATGGGGLTPEDAVDVVAASMHGGTGISVVYNDAANTITINSVGAAGYIHLQSSPAAVWTIIHNLNRYPNVTVEDSAGETVEGEVVYNNSMQLTLSFSAVFSGVAYLT